MQKTKAIASVSDVSGCQVMWKPVREKEIPNIHLVPLALAEPNYRGEISNVGLAKKSVWFFP